MSSQTEPRAQEAAEARQAALAELRKVRLQTRRRRVERPAAVSLYCGVALLGVTIYNAATLWPISENLVALLLIFSGLLALGLIGWAILLWTRPDPLPSELHLEILPGGGYRVGEAQRRHPAHAVEPYRSDAAEQVREELAEKYSVWTDLVIEQADVGQMPLHLRLSHDPWTSARRSEGGDAAK